MKEQILELRAQKKTYDEIKEILGCSKGTISYHCGEGQKEKTNKRKLKNRSNKPLLKKLEEYKSKGTRNKARDFQRLREGGKITKERDYNFKEIDVLEKIENSPICYLTGRKIDIFKTSSYHFDHIIPAAKGGTNELNNLGVACKEANMAKSDMLLEDFIQLCKEVLENNGYAVNKK